jgi:hypothetical protein
MHKKFWWGNPKDTTRHIDIYQNKRVAVNTHKITKTKKKVTNIHVNAAQ